MKNINQIMKEARVLLLNPPTAAVSTGALLNLAYLAVSLRKAGHEARIIDATAPYKPFTPEQIKKFIAEFKPHFIGVTLCIDYIPQTYAYLKDLRKMGIPIVAGGPHPSSLPEEVLANATDIVVIGEGEETIVELAEYFLGDGKQLKDIAGICFRDIDKKPVYTLSRKLIEHIDTIPFPDFGDFPIKNYTGSEDVNSNPIFWSIFSSRGCPFNCIFCSSHNVFGRSVRMRSANNIVEEIKGLVSRFGVEKITFQDDEILCSKERFLKLCDLIAKSELRIKMSIRTRIDSIDKEILLKAKAAGLTRISFGIESWNDDTLNRINKRYTVKTIQEKFKLIEETKFPFISFNNLCGFPWETKEHFRRNIDEISKISQSILYFTNTATPIPYPETKLYDTYHKQFGFTDWWLDPNKHVPPLKESPFFIYFAYVMWPLYIPDFFWNYSRKNKKMIEVFCWKLFDLLIKRHYRLFTAIFIIILSRFSYLIWKIFPKFERLVFSLLPNTAILRLKEKVIFTKKY